MTRQERTRRRWQRNNMKRNGKRRVLMSNNQTFCLYCLSDTNGTMYCNRQCRSDYRNKIERRVEDKLPRVKWDHARITEKQVRAEEGLDRPKHEPLHNRFCNCPACRDRRQQARLEVARRTVAEALAA